MVETATAADTTHRVALDYEAVSWAELDRLVACEIMEEPGALAELRAEAGMRQVELADALGVSRGAVSHYETGRRPIPWPLAYRAAVMLLDVAHMGRQHLHDTQGDNPN